MKLLSKYNRINIITTVSILLLSSLAYYFLIRNTLIHQLDKDLRIEQKELMDFISKKKALPDPLNFKDEQESFLPIKDSIPKKFSNIDIYNKEHHEFFSYRQIEFAVSINHLFYKVTIRKSLGETEDMIQLILITTLGLVVLLLLALFLINRFLFNNLWKPFSNTLHHLKSFDLSTNKPLFLPETKIDEFSELNHAVSMMTNKAVHDYNEIRNFTENASHEIQTPLAIIKSRLELLSQGEFLKEEQMDNIQTIFEATNRLSRLNQSLLLLTKIDNQQFQQTQEVEISVITTNILINYEELLTGKKINLSTQIKSPVLIRMNESLAEILISNLITNAIKHNNKEGFINIKLDDDRFEISNSGKILEVPPMSLFERFKKEKAASDSLGLGLSIVKKIAETYHFTIDYNCINLVHTVRINFNLSPNLLQN